MKAVVILVLVSVFYMSVPVVSACSCAELGSPQEQLAESTAVFAGKAVDHQPGQYLFEVSEIWKGPDYEQLVIKASSESSLCGIQFTLDQEYLIFAYGEDDNLRTGLCSGSRPLVNAGETVQALGEGKFPTISGSNVPYLPPSTTSILPLLVVVLAVLIVVIFVFRKKR